MFSSNAQQEFKKTLQEFTQLKQQEHSYAYTTGYLESLCAEMFGLLNNRDQKQMAQQLEKAVDTAQNGVILKEW
jgi:hypothetical protein